MSPWLPSSVQSMFLRGWVRFYYIFIPWIISNLLIYLLPPPIQVIKSSPSLSHSVENVTPACTSKETSVRNKSQYICPQPFNQMAHMEWMCPMVTTSFFSLMSVPVRVSICNTAPQCSSLFWGDAGRDLPLFLPREEDLSLFPHKFLHRVHCRTWDCRGEDWWRRSYG